MPNRSRHAVAFSGASRQPAAAFCSRRSGLTPAAAAALTLSTAPAALTHEELLARDKASLDIFWLGNDVPRCDVSPEPRGLVAGAYYAADGDPPDGREPSMSRVRIRSTIDHRAAQARSPADSPARDWLSRGI